MPNDHDRIVITLVVLQQKFVTSECMSESLCVWGGGQPYEAEGVSSKRTADETAQRMAKISSSRLNTETLGIRVTASYTHIHLCVFVKITF